MTNEEALLASLLERKLVMVTGKGGSGKSTLSVMLARRAAALGKRVLLVEAVACAGLAPLFGHQSKGHSEIKVAPGISCLNLDTAACIREYVVQYLGMKTLYETVFRRPVVQSFLKAVPGLAETMLLGRLFFTAHKQLPSRFDLVIYDGHASGHFESFIRTPDSIIKTGMMGPLVHEVQKIREFMTDSTRCSLVYLTLPEDLVSSETLDFVPRLQAVSPAELSAVFVNRAGFADGELPKFGASEPERLLGAYLKRRCETKERNEAIMHQLGGRQTALSLVYLPDLGVIPEPIDESYVTRFWSLRTEGGEHGD